MTVRNRVGKSKHKPQLRDLQHKLRRGCELSNEEIKRIDQGVDYDGVSMDVIYELDRENQAIQESLEELQVKVRRAEIAEAVEATEDLFLHTRNVSLQEEVRRNMDGRDSPSVQPS